MRHGLLGSIAALAAGAGLAFAQTPARTPLAGADVGRAVAQPTPVSVEPVPLGPSTLGSPPADSAFYAAMQPQMPPGNEEPQLNAERGYAQLDYLLWFIRTMPSSFPLVTASTTGPRGAVGPTTSNVFGAQDFQLNPISGGRVTLDYWLPRNRRFGAEFVGTVLETRVDQFVAGVGTQMVARPVIDANTGVPASLTVAAPNYARGGVSVDVTSQFWGFEYNGKFKFWCDATREFSFLGGFRYVDLAESIDIFQRSIFVPGVTTFFYGVNFFNPTEIDVADTFQTRNQYYLGQIGLQGKWRYKRWSTAWAAKFAIGAVHETLVINGNSTLTPTATSAPSTVPGGLLALSSNIGRYHDDPFAFVPEGSLQIGYRFFRATDFVVGYQFTYLSRAIRPGDQIDAAVSSNLIPTAAAYGVPGGTNRPAAATVQSNLWVQGLNFGLHIHY